uniref:Troponin T2d, cardiac n=1 Tax=Globodera pallida TaxID=36090 RepID=A0A183BZT8_GLOPA
MDNIFCNTFGKALEKKKYEFDETKSDLKQNVKRIFEDPKVMPSPSRKVKPAIALMKRINEFKEMENSAKKEKEVDRDKKAQKNREEQLKDKAERTKRERGGVMSLCNFIFTFLLFLGGMLVHWMMEM